MKATLPEHRDPYGLPIPGQDSPAYPFFIIEAVCIFYFVIELFLRFWVSHTNMEFFSDILNIIDILAIIPFFTDILLVLLGMVILQIPWVGGSASMGISENHKKRYTIQNIATIH